MFGDLGAGKTTFLKGVIHHVTQVALEEIHSPTFSYLQIYEGAVPVFHFDLYRLSGERELIGMGLDEYLTQPALILIEWPERILSLLPGIAAAISIVAVSECERKITLFRGNR